VANFTDTDPGGTVSDYSAAVTWGDGTTSSGTIGASGTGFTVSGTHAYAHPGSYSVSVTIADAGGSQAPASSTINVGAQAVTGEPVILSGPPITTTPSQAVLSAQLQPDGLTTTYYFQYGIDSKYRLTPTNVIVYDQRTPDQVLGATTAQTAVTATASPLVPNALYHARLVATNSAGTTFGPDIAFTTQSDAKGLPKPALGKSVDASVVSGQVFIKLPGASSAKASKGRKVQSTIPNNQGYLPLTEPLQLPVRTKVDALKGTLRLVTASQRKSKTQTGTFGGGLFSIAQKAHGANKALTTLSILEGAFSGAPSYASCQASAHTASVGATVARLSRRVLQTLRSSAHGRFRTRGRYSASTVRGTKWNTSDRCDGTLTKVITDKVAVTDFVRHVTVVVHAGHHYLARKR
jgi:hypothetical protein